MKNNKFYALAGFLGLVITTLVVSSMASAYQGDPNVQGPNFDPIRHESMMEAFENNDYSAWAELHDGRGKMSEVVTEDNFDRFTAMHELMLAGDKDGAQEIREELGLGKGRMGKGSHRGGQRGSGDCQFNK
jgi:hypothetical protein